MGRKIVGIIAGVSLILCIAFAGLWVRSEFRADTVGWAGWKDQPAGIWQGWGIMSESGLLYAYSFEGTYQLDNPRAVYPNAPTMKPHIVHEAPHASGMHGAKRFRWDSQRFGGTTLYTQITFRGAPAWFVTGALGVIPVWYGIVVVIPFLRRRRIVLRGGRCRGCLYDLRGNASGVCPECGRAVLAKHAKPTSAAIPSRV